MAIVPVFVTVSASVVSNDTLIFAPSSNVTGQLAASSR